MMFCENFEHLRSKAFRRTYRGITFCPVSSSIHVQADFWNILSNFLFFMNIC